MVGVSKSMDVMEAMIRVNHSTVGVLRGWGQYATILQGGVVKVGCGGVENNHSLVEVVEGMVYRGKGEMREDDVICVMVGEEEVMIVMVDGEEECDEYGWCSQYQEEEDCNKACHLITRQRCR